MRYPIACPLAAAIVVVPQHLDAGALQNIQDAFNEAGIEIMSPHYIATRDGSETTIPKDDLREKKQ